MSGGQGGRLASSAGLAGLVSLTALSGLLVGCQTPPGHDPWVNEQLGAVVATQAPECGVVRMVQRAQRLDYRVVCQSGSVYRVRVRPDGRVTVTLEEPGPAPPAAGR